MEPSSTPIRALIVDGQDRTSPAIRSLLNRYADVDVVGECRGEREGLRAIRESSPDLVFLDVATPVHRGFEAMRSHAARVRPYPYFIFVTAREELKTAREGFKRATLSQSVDYLLKPLDESRFDEALARARTVLSHAHYATAPRPGLSQTPMQSDPLERIAVKSRGQILVLRVREIDWVKAEQDYVGLHVGSKSWLMREPISALEARLSACGFVRIHRSTLVNVDRVRELRPLAKGEFTVVLFDGTELKLSRNFRSSLSMIAGYGFP
jgi:two-component system, LytTR family, response regulator